MANTINMQPLVYTRDVYGAIEKFDMTVIDFYNNNWSIRFGGYGAEFEAKFDDKSIAELASLLSAMLLSHDEEEAARSGDANTPWKYDDEACPICGAPLPCPTCLNELRCDNG